MEFRVSQTCALYSRNVEYDISNRDMDMYMYATKVWVISTYNIGMYSENRKSYM